MAIGASSKCLLLSMPDSCKLSCDYRLFASYHFLVFLGQSCHCSYFAQSRLRTSYLLMNTIVPNYCAQKNNLPHRPWLNLVTQPRYCLVLESGAASCPCRGQKAERLPCSGSRALFRLGQEVRPPLLSRCTLLPTRIGEDWCQHFSAQRTLPRRFTLRHPSSSFGP